MSWTRAWTRYAQSRIGCALQRGARGFSKQAEELVPPERPTLFKRLKASAMRNRTRLAGTLLALGALGSSTRLWAEVSRYNYDIAARDKRIALLTRELQGRFDMEYASLDTAKRQRKVLVGMVDAVAADWPTTRPVKPLEAQQRIDVLRDKIDGWFANQIKVLQASEDDPFLAKNQAVSGDEAGQPAKPNKSGFV